MRTYLAPQFDVPLCVVKAKVSRHRLQSEQHHDAPITPFEASWVMPAQSRLRQGPLPSG